MKTQATRVLVVSMVAMAGAAWGQEGQKPLLSGPEVKDTRPALVEDDFGGMKSGKERMGAMNAIPAQDLREILRTMNAPESDPALRLSEEQAGRVRELMREFEQERRAYMQEHRDELQAMMKEAGVRPEAIEEREPGARGQRRDDRRERVEPAERDMREPIGPEGARRMQRPAVDRRGPDAGGPGPEGRPGPEEKPTPEQEAARRKLRDFMQSGPSTGDLQRRIYAELSPEQQGFIDAEVKRLADERANEREMAQIERKLQDRAQQQPGARPGAQVPAGGNRARIDWDKVYNQDGSVNIEALPERVRERLENLSEQDRKRAVDALKKRFETGQRLQGQKKD